MRAGPGLGRLGLASACTPLVEGRHRLAGPRVARQHPSRRHGRRDDPLRRVMGGIARRLAAKAGRGPPIRKPGTGLDGPETGGRVPEGLTRP